MELVVLIVFLGLLFDYTNGFHDAANVVSTVIATKALRPLIAILIAALLNFVGATQISGVAETIATGLISPHDTTNLVVFSAVVGAITWNLLTWYMGIPSSSSYALIGGMIGSSWMHIGFKAILWSGIFWKVIIPMLLSPLVGFIIGLLVMNLLYIYTSRDPSRKDKKLFRYLQIGSSSLVALSHGMNDAQKSMGLITLGLFTSGYLAAPTIPFWVIIACASVIGLGTASGGFRIIRTMGFEITKVDTPQGFAAECSSAFVILGASFLGIPVSSTQVITGGITGVGRAKGKRAVRWKVPKRIALTWLFTLPGAFTVGALSYFLTSLFL